MGLLLLLLLLLLFAVMVVVVLMVVVPTSKISRMQLSGYSLQNNKRMRNGDKFVQQDRQSTYNVTLRRVLATMAAVENQ